ncbi:MAG: beta-lactamase family protein [Candidatus Aminicenantes bacterium]|nr:beta-lactamase family protein [Candidatus Aminicenantes bacterium]
MKNWFVPIFAFSVLAVVGHSGDTQAALPETPAGRHVEAYVRAFNAGESAMREFFAGHIAKGALQKTPVEARMERYKQMHDRLGSLELQKLVESRSDFVSVVARTANGPFVRLDFQFEPAEPFGLLGIRIEAMEDAGEESASAAAKKNNDELLAAVREYGEKVSRAEDFSGVILVAQNGVSLFEQAYGYADREKKIPNRIDTKFNVGSINKSFTGLAIRQLVAEKKVSLDDPVGKFLPDYPNRDAAAKVTVRHLLNMTSGVGDFFGDRYVAAPKEKIRSLADYLPLFADKPLEFEPGAREQYSNGGYVVLGLIIEKASGADYYTYVRDHIFKPAGMNDSASYEKDAAVPNRAIGYVRDGSSWKPNYETLPGRGSSAGGGYSTARDLLKYTIALGKGTLAGAGEEIRGGFGIAGGAPGLNAVLEWDPQSGYVVAVLSNLGPPSAERVGRQIRYWLPR